MRLPVVEITVEQKLHQGTHRKTGGIPCPSGQAGFLVTFSAKSNKEEIV